MNGRKICHLITTLGSGGAESMLFKLLSEASRTSEFRHVVISLTDEGTFGKRLSDRGVVVHSLRMKPGVVDLRSLRTLYSVLKEESPAILMTWLYHADLLGLIVGRIAGIRRIVWNIRTSKLNFAIYKGSIKYVFQANRRLSHFPDSVIYNSMAGYRDHSAAGFNPKRWTYVPNGFDMDAFKPRPDARENLRTSLRLNHSALLVGMVARYDPVKDHQSFLSAAAQLSQEIDNVHFVLVGRDERDQLRRAVLEMGLSDRVHLLGERTDIAEINAGLDVATLTSSFGEGFPNVLGEAMACGIPCVSTDVGDARTVVGDHGIIVPPANVTALGRAWAGILRMPASERKRIGEEGRNRIVQNFSIAVVAAQYEQLFTKLAS